MKKFLLIIFSTLLFFNVAYAECTSGNCKNGQGTSTWPDGAKYVGEFKNDKRHGQGTFTWPDKDKYVGEFKDGLKSGQGTLIYADGEKYVGEFEYGEPIK